MLLEDIYAASYLAMRGVAVDVVEDPERRRKGRPFTVFRVPREAAPLLGEYAGSELAEFAQQVRKLRARSLDVRRAE